MSTITLPNFRTTADVTMNTRLKDGGVYIDWAGLTNIKAWLYSDAQKAMAGRCVVSINQADSTKLVCEYSATKPQYLGVQRLIIQAKYMGRTKTYDKVVFNFVPRTDDQEGTQIVMDDPVVDVEIDVQDVTSSILDNILAACIKATEEAREAVDVHRGPAGVGFESLEQTEESDESGGTNIWTARLTDGTTHEFQVKNGQAGAGLDSVEQTTTSHEDEGVNVITFTMKDGTEQTAEIRNGSKGSKGDQGEKGDKGDQGNTGSSVDYPYELVNNRTTNDATKGLSAAEGYRLGQDLSQLGDKVDDLNSDPVDIASLDLVAFAYLTTSNKWISSSGSTRNGSFIDVNPGDMVRIVAGALGGRYSFLTERPSTVTAGGTPPFVPETAGNTMEANTTIDVTIPSGCTCLHVNRYYGSDDYSPTKIAFLGVLLPKLEEAVEESSDEIMRIGENFTTFESPNLFDKTKITTGKFVNKTSGALSNSSDWVASDYIDVSGFPVGTKIYIKKTALYSGSVGMAAYNSGGTFTHGLGGAITLESGDASVRVSVPAGEVDTAMIYVGDAPARYYPFGTLTSLKDSSVNTETLADESVTDEKLSVKKRISIPLSIIGQDTEQVTSDAIYDFAVGQGYRCAILTPNVPLADTSGSNWRFQLRAYDANGDEVATIARYSTAKQLPDYVDFVVPAGTDHIRILARCVAGVTFSVSFLPAVSASTGGILVDNPDAEFVPKFMSAKKRYYTSTDTGYPTPLVMLHLSDIHGNWDNVSRYLQFANHHRDNIDLLVNTGDTVVNKYTDGITGYAALSGIEKVLNIIGNHDTRGDSWAEYAGTPAYNLLIKPFVSEWNVVQPSNAEANGYCYYYKDFTEKSIRVVAVDVMGYNSIEDSWLAGVLADARTNSLHVVILTHFSCPRPYEERTQDVFDVEPCNYSTLYPFGSDSTNLTGYNNNAYLMAETVNDFIEAGGHFVGYVQGHYHADFIAKGDKYPNQLIYAIGSSKSGEVKDYDHVLNTRFQDEFQIVAIDTKDTIVKLFKVGANIDRYGRSKGGVCVDYSTGRILGECFL